jgi:hypothetical protein
MLTATFDQLKNAAQKYLDDLAFGVPEVAALMAEVFGNNPDGTDVAMPWPGLLTGGS